MKGAHESCEGVPNLLKEEQHMHDSRKGLTLVKEDIWPHKKWLTDWYSSKLMRNQKSGYMYHGTIL
jgi:hypothetical protein